MTQLHELNLFQSIKTQVVKVLRELDEVVRVESIQLIQQMEQTHEIVSGYIVTWKLMVVVGLSSSGMIKQRTLEIFLQVLLENIK